MSSVMSDAFALLFVPTTVAQSYFMDEIWAAVSRTLVGRVYIIISLIFALVHLLL